MRLPIPGLLLLAGLLTGLSACRAAPRDGELPSETPAPPPVSATASSPAAATKVPSGLTGVALSASDVSGQPDLPLAGQLLLALPVSQAGAALGLEGQDLSPERLRFLKAGLPQRDASMAVTRSDAAGRYTLLLEPGDYVLCVAESEQNPPDFPATTRGCGLAQVREGELRRVDISSGFGEILLIER
jgi:hypothetical protein